MSGPNRNQAEDTRWHVLNEYGTTDCPVQMVRANADPDEDGRLECSACGAEVSR